MKKKLLSIALVLMLLLSLVPSMALADEDEGVYVSVGGQAFTAYDQTINVGGGTATLTTVEKYNILHTMLILDNVRISDFDEIEDAEGTVYKCGIVIMCDDDVYITTTGYNTITAPEDTSDAVYEGMYLDVRNAYFRDNFAIDFSGLDVGIESAKGFSASGGKLNFYNCYNSILTVDGANFGGNYQVDGCVVNISGNGSIGILGERCYVCPWSTLNIKLDGEGQPVRYGIYADDVELQGTTNIDVSIKDVAEQELVVVNAVCATNKLTVGSWERSYVTANASADNCPSAAVVAIAAVNLVSTGPADQNGYCRKGTIDAKAAVTGEHTVAQAISCESLSWAGTLKAQVTGASADDVAVAVASKVTMSYNKYTPYLYASIDAQDSNYGAVVLPKMSDDDTDRVPNQYVAPNQYDSYDISLFITQPANVQLKDITEDGVDYQIVVDENGVPVNCVYGNSEGYKFTDITTLNDSYKAAIAWASDTGVTGGYSDFTFRPQNTCTRAQVVTFIWRANGCPEPAGTAAGFNDVPESAYYYKAVLWAAEQGITSGFDDGGFHPDETVTRAQAMTFIWRAENKPAAPEGTVNEFVDVSEANYYYDAVLWAVANGITGGYNNTLFGSNDGCTRAQIVTFLHRNMA